MINDMRIFRLIYEEIDTEDKQNPETNIRLQGEKRMSSIELLAMSSPTLAICDIQNALFCKIVDEVQTLKSFIKEEKDYTGDISKNKSVAPLVGVIDRRVFEEKDTLKSVKE